RPCLFRPPYGSYDATTLDSAQSAGMATWNWSVDTEDWKAEGSASSLWVRRIINRAEAGASQLHPVILMHNQATPNPATVAALGPVIDFYRARGYTFVDLYGRTWLRPTPAVARTASGLHVFTVRPDGGVNERTHADSTWGRQVRLGGHVVGGVAAVAVGTRAVALAGRGVDGHVRVLLRGDHGHSRWLSIGGPAASVPALASQGSGRVSVVVQGVDDAAWLREWVKGSWRPWLSLGGHLVEAPAVAPIGARDLAVVGVDSRGRVVERDRVGGTWSGWRVIGGEAAGAPALRAFPSVGRLVLAVRTARGGLRVRRACDPRSWGSWHRVRAALSSSAGVLVDGKRVRVVAFRNHGTLAQTIGHGRLRSPDWNGWHVVRR
ncbi:MAG: hypothetical protein QOJ03_3230, partial [Frankiaceae bacterium]|nr:hypothetical protein [Frankiaceae bacterium]